MPDDSCNFLEQTVALSLQWVALYDAVSRMRLLPVSRATMIPLALAAAVPLVPVFATQMPLKDAVLKVLMPLIGL